MNTRQSQDRRRTTAPPFFAVSSSHAGQAMIESVFVIILICFTFLAVFQYANLFAAKAVLTHAAARAARARTVGFNRWMVEKSARVASIPASGRRITPATTGVSSALTEALADDRPGEIWDFALQASTRSAGTQVEAGRVPDYMASVNDPTAENLLDYELWDAMTVDLDESIDVDGTAPATLRVTVRQRHPLLLALEPLAEGVMSDPGDDTFALAGFFSIESHYPLYLEDMNW